MPWRRPHLPSPAMSADTSPAIELRGASKTFRTPSGGLHTAVRGLGLTVGRGEFVAGVGDRYPHQLPGGQRKRVALAATFVNDPEILLMDEPFSALDVQTRALMSDELLELWEGTGASVVFVTHDLEESIALADKVVVMTAGPATVKEVFAVDLPRPRRVEEVRLEPRVVEIYREIW